MALFPDNWMRVFDISDTSKHAKGFTIYKIVSIVRKVRLEFTSKYYVYLVFLRFILKIALMPLQKSQFGKDTTILRNYIGT